MRTPIRPTPELVERWIARARRLRWLDALAGWLVLWFALAGALGHVTSGQAALAALALLGLLALVPPLRVRWRVVSGAVGLWMSRAIAVGDRAWCIGPGSATRVIVTARRGARVTVANTGGDAAEGVSVRRTRVLLVSP
jgi:hypothetical protein